MEKGRCCDIFWRTGFIPAIESYRQATGVQTGDGVHYFGKEGVLRHFPGFKCRDPRIVCAEKILRGSRKGKREEKIFGVQEKQKRNENPEWVWCSDHGYPCVTIYFGIQVDVLSLFLRRF
jgi:hypothetical protein